MADQPGTDIKLPDPAELSKNMMRIAAQSQQLVTDFLSRNAGNGELGSVDPLNLGGAFLEMTAKMMANPTLLVEAQFDLWQKYLSLWSTTTQRLLGQEVAPVATPDKGDRRFKDAAWDENQVFDFIKQSYLLTARWMQSKKSKKEKKKRR